MIDLNRQPGETEEQYVWRIGCAYDSGTLDMKWDEIGDVINKTFRTDDEPFRDPSAYRKLYQYSRRMYDAGVFGPNNTGNADKSIEDSVRELRKEKIKLQTEKLEYNRWLREDARDELLAEKMASAIKEAPVIAFPALKIDSSPSQRSGVLVAADSHYGAEFCIRGLKGEIINEYSPEIFEDRMRSLLDQTVRIARAEGLNELTVYSLGDSTDGLLRVGQLMKLRYGVVDQAVNFANYLAYWLNELTKYDINVKFQMVFGNHTELRFFNQKKGAFKDENVGKFIREIIRARLDGNPRFTMIDNPTGLIFDEIQGYTVLGIHGDVKSMNQSISELSNTYKTNIDILIGGHMHHLSEETVGVDREIISVPSIIGIDDFSMSLNKTSRPGASLLIIEKGNGVVTEHRIKL